MATQTPTYEVHPFSFPAQTRTATTTINNTPTTATSTSFSDKILLTITFSPSSSPKSASTILSRPGTLSHWIHVPLSSASSLQDPAIAARSDSGDLLPRTDLTATTVLGGTKREDEALGQTLGTLLASQVLVKAPGEERMLVLGVGPLGGLGRDGLGELVGLCLGVL